MKPGLTAFLFIVHFLAFAQDSRRTALKIYMNTDWYETSYLDYRTGNTSEDLYFQTLRPSFAFEREKERFTHQLEVFLPDLKRPVSKTHYPGNNGTLSNRPGEHIVTSFALRYELGKPLYTSEHLRFLIAAGANPYFLHYEYVPEDARWAQTDIDVLGLGINIVPSVSFKAWKHITIEVGFPLKLYDLQWKKSAIHNPALSFREQHKSEIESLFFGKVYTFRLGAAYHF